MFLNQFDPEHFGAGEAERLATFDRWADHFSQDRYSHGNDTSREAWAELSATTEAIIVGSWTSGDKALDYAVAISSYTDFLSGPTDEKVNPRRRRIAGLLQDCQKVNGGDVVLGLDHRLNRKRPTLRVGIIGAIGLNLVSESDGSFLSGGKLVFDTGKTYLRSKFTATYSGLEADEVEVNTVDDDLPVHGTFDRPKFAAHPWEHVTLDPEFSTFSKMFGPAPIRPCEIHLGEQGIDGFLRSKLPDGNMLQPYLSAVGSLIESARNQIQVS